MEERIIDDEYGRGIRLKKTKDGYVDVTDELAEKGEKAEETGAEYEGEEVAFEFPMLDSDEDDEELVGLTPEEAAALAVLTIVLGLQNFTTRENTYILPTILCGAGFAVVFIAFILLTNKWINDMRIYRANERLSSTEEGARLEEVRDYLDLYGALLGLNAEQAEETDGTEETENE